MRIRVLQRHIDCGVRGVGTRCPVALAVEEATGGPAYVSAHGRVYWDRGHGRIYSGEVFGKVEAFVWRFDIGEAVEPFEFDLPIDEPPPVVIGGGGI